ncbi:hypothetical protein CALVIDRAFT_136182 [Calocera viscosa TUFC12733]|uniref:BZIP domain-containing protein n=1 Tax=Calocera viscosa (strain TUFC12733) TaxID=1330018 RepID=A0A167LXL6_CALVF|nr:hypothetical protein CALVIDRAFT_136182 [Calocera viscosa TUFC12733]
MASPSPFLFDTNAYPPIDTSFTQYEPMPGEDGLQFPGNYGINQQFPTQSHYSHHLQPMPIGHSPMPNMSGSMTPLSMPSAGAYSLQAINMQSSGVSNNYQQQLFAGHTPPPLSASSSSSSDSLQTTVSMSDIMPAPPMTSASDSSLTAMSPSPSMDDDDDMSRSPSPSPRMTRAHLKREATTVSLHASHNSPSKKRKTSSHIHQRGKLTAPHLPPVITKPMDPNGPRITCATFVWPDVSGLSKKDARLVKNRAAAFLSRQRKREEFEAMEK